MVFRLLIVFLSRFGGAVGVFTDTLHQIRDKQGLQPRDQMETTTTISPGTQESDQHSNLNEFDRLIQFLISIASEVGW